VSRRRPFVLAILDGWGYTSELHGNAIAAADLPNWKRILDTYPHTLLEASGLAVGLPDGVMGNSEVGHINMGSGRVVPQGLVVIDAEIASGTFGENATLRACIAHVQKTNGTLHLVGLVSDGKVHSSLDHLDALIDVACKAGLPLAVDAFLDGRDTPPSSAATYLAHVEAHLAGHGRTGAIATICGRYYAMDRDKRWDRTRRAYRRARQRRERVPLPQRGGRSRRGVRARRNRRVRRTDDRRRTHSDPRRRRLHLLQLPPGPGARQLTLAFSDPGFDYFPVHRFEDFVFATMDALRGELPKPGAFRTAPAVRRLRRDRRERRTHPASLGGDREVRARHVFLQRRARGRVPRRRSHPHPVQPERRDLRPRTRDGRPTTLRSPQSKTSHTGVTT